MRSVILGVGTSAARLQSRVSGAPARHRFALAGFALAMAVGAAAPSLAHFLAIPVEAALILVLSVGFVAVGWLLGRQVDALTVRSLEDPMTHVGNRRHWEECLAEELDRAVRSRMPLSLLMLDVDNLKTINDRHGHAIGDRALALVGEVLRETCRSRDVAARFGGDEFAILLPRTRASEAKVVAERIRTALAERRALVGAPIDSLLTVSMGIADLEAVRDPQADLLFEAADQALYTAKERGRDCIEVKEALCFSGIICLDQRRKAKKNGRASA